MNTLYIVLEYIFVPVIGVLFTFIIRFLLSSARKDVKEHIVEICYDMMIMCIFSIVFFILGANAHSDNNSQISILTTIGFILALILAIMIIGIAVYDQKELKLEIEKRYIYLRNLTLMCSLLLISFVTWGVTIDHPNIDNNTKVEKTIKETYK